MSETKGRMFQAQGSPGKNMRRSGKNNRGQARLYLRVFGMVFYLFTTLLLIFQIMTSSTLGLSSA